MINKPYKTSFFVPFSLLLSLTMLDLRNVICNSPGHARPLYQHRGQNNILGLCNKWTAPYFKSIQIINTAIVTS